MIEVASIVAQATEVLHKDGIYLDEGRFDEWLELYTRDCEFWAPTWRTEEELVDSPHTGLSHLYFSDRGGLEDRVRRLRSGFSPASTPMPRTCHLLGNVMALEAPSAERVRLRASWHCDVFFVRSNTSVAFFGRSVVELVQGDVGWQIRRKKAILLNDYVPTMLDFYCL